MGGREPNEGKNIVDTPTTGGVCLGLHPEVVLAVPKHSVNLDALIRREFFEVAVDPKTVQLVEEAPKLKIMELEADSFMYRGIIGFFSAPPST